MKKFLSVLLTIIMIISFTACSKQKAYTIEDIEEIVSPYMSVLSIGIADDWCDSAEDTLLSKADGAIFKTILENIYRIDNNADIYNSDYKVKLSDYVDTAVKYFNYDKNFITEYFKADRTYDAETSMLSCSDGLGNVISIEINSVEADGNIFKINYDCYGVEDYYIENYGFLTVEITEKGTPRFSANTVNKADIKVSNPIPTEEVLAALAKMSKTEACDYLQQHYTEPLEKAMLLTKEASDGMNLDQKYIFYYFGSVVLNNIDYYKENYPVGSEKNTVCVPTDEVEEYLGLFIEGIGNIALRLEDNGYYNKEQNGYEYFVGETSWIIDNTQVFDYYIDEEKLIINYYILPIDTEDKIPMTAVFHKNGDYYKYYRTLSLSGIYTKAAEKDGYAISLENNGFSGELSQATLINTSTGETNLLDIFSYYNSDVGFFKNGDVYVMDDYGMNVYNPQINMTDKTPIFTTDTNFPCGKDIYPDGTDRHLFAIRREPDKMDYIVIYGEYIEKENYEDNYVSDLQMVHTYKVGLLDKDGNLTESWDTGVNIMFSRGFDDVFMTKPSENEIEFFVKFKTEERLRGRFNLETGVYTPVKEFEPW